MTDLICAVLFLALVGDLAFYIAWRIKDPRSYPNPWPFSGYYEYLRFLKRAKESV